MKFNIVLEKAEEGGYNVTVPAIVECCIQGDSEEEAIGKCKKSYRMLSGGTGKNKSNLF